MEHVGGVVAGTTADGSSHVNSIGSSSSSSSHNNNHISSIGSSGSRNNNHINSIHCSSNNNSIRSRSNIVIDADKSGTDRCMAQAPAFLSAEPQANVSAFSGEHAHPAPTPPGLNSSDHNPSAAIEATHVYSTDDYGYATIAFAFVA